MGPLLLCVLSVLSPQEPPTPPAGAAPAPATAPRPVTPADERAALAAAELAGPAADPHELARLAGTGDGAVANRAAWLLAQRQDRPARTVLVTVATTSPHAEARAHALQALATWREASSTAAGIDCLQHGDRVVRTLAAQLLGALRRPSAIEPLAAMLDRARDGVAPGAATDLAAALVALADLQAADVLLRATLAVHDSKVEGTGPALAYCCQQLVPKLSDEARRSFLLTAVAHREPLVRRHAIGALAETADPTIAKVLEGRLATENDELRPLVALALERVRHDPTAQVDGELARAMHNLQGLGAWATRRWQAAGMVERSLLAGTPVVLLVLWLLLRARRRKAAAAAAAAVLIDAVQPSAEYLEAEALDEAAMAEATGDEAVDGGTTLDGQLEPDAASEQYEHAGSRQ